MSPPVIFGRLHRSAGAALPVSGLIFSAPGGPPTAGAVDTGASIDTWEAAARKLTGGSTTRRRFRTTTGSCMATGLY
ncbi:exported protein of unknown function [Cupriavidus taiwanensis]|nr:exported protein of unknown function [Cupriavidus taiwanensis]